MTAPADPPPSTVGPMSSPSPVESSPLPAAPRPSIAHRLSGHRRVRYLYKVANRLERKRFLDSLPGEALESDAVIGRRDGRLVLYRTQPGMTGDVARSENLRLVAELLDRHDVDYFAAPESGSGSVNIGMAPQAWDRLLEVLATGHAQRVYWWRMVARGYGLVCPEEGVDGRVLRRRPAFRAMAHMLARLGGSQCEGPVPDLPDAVRAYRYRYPDGTATVAAWTVGEARGDGGHTRIALPGEVAGAHDRDGTTVPVDGLPLVGPRPVYLDLKGSATNG